MILPSYGVHQDFQLCGATVSGQLTATERKAYRAPMSRYVKVSILDPEGNTRREYKVKVSISSNRITYMSQIITSSILSELRIILLKWWISPVSYCIRVLGPLWRQSVAKATEFV